METITIKKFKSLVPADSPDRKEAYGLFAISEKSLRKQCENLKVGDTVFYFDTKDNGVGDDGIPQVDITIVQAIVVEDAAEGRKTMGFGGIGGGR